MNRRDTLKTIGIGALFGGMAGTSTAMPDSNGTNNPGRVGNYNGQKTLVPPDLGGFDHVLLYLADADPFPDWDRVAKAEFFNREIMGRSTEEIFEVRKAAIDFHWERFGIDFPYPEDEEDLFSVVDSQGDIDATFSPGMLNPGTGYTAYVVSGKAMPNTYRNGMTNTDTHSTGKVRDGSWGATLNEDATLGGTYGATGDSDVPAGTSVTFGDYSIRMGDNEDPIEIRFLSEHPIVRRGRVPSAFNCDLEHDEWGEGQVHGTLGGTLGSGLRNVLTFPPSLDG